MFVIFSLVQPLEPWPTSSTIFAGDVLLFVTSAIIAAMIGVTFVRMYHQHMIAYKVSELSDLSEDQKKFHRVVDELTKREFPLFAQLSIAMTMHPRIVLFLGTFIFGLMWIAALC